MTIRKHIWTGLAIGSSLTSAVIAGTIDFENAPSDHWTQGTQGGTAGGLGIGIGDYWDGVTFLGSPTILEIPAPGAGTTQYPPSSGSAVLWPGVDYHRMVAEFDTAVGSVGLSYTAGLGLTLFALDANGSVLAKAFGGANLGQSSRLEVTGPQIKKIVLLGGTADLSLRASFTIDDLTSDSVSGDARSLIDLDFPTGGADVPDSLGTLSALALALGGLWAFRRK